MTAEDEKAYLSALGLRIWVLRKKRQIRQRRLGTLCGLSASAISDLETGARAPNILTLRRVAAGLAAPLHTLVDESNVPFRPKRWAGSDSRPAPCRR
jgi:transcriptional regulator with XRE-family HTH domain